MDILEGIFHGVVANIMDCDVVVSKFEFQSLYCIHFRTNTLGKDMDLLILQVLVKL